LSAELAGSIGNVTKKVLVEHREADGTLRLYHCETAPDHV
jgi:hypothetical protein